MDPILTVLSQLGLGVATNAVYDVLKSVAAKQGTVEQAVVEIQNTMNLYGVNVRAETVINAIADNGLLIIRRSDLYANNLITFGSVRGSASIGDVSSLRTGGSSIEIGRGASMETHGNAQVVLNNPDGSVSFNVGKK